MSFLNRFQVILLDMNGTFMFGQDRFDGFPQVADVIHSLHPVLSSDERRLIEEVIAIHELGHVPDAHAACLRRLARTHRLGLVANVWCKKDRWLRELERVGVLDLFETLVFSSDHKSMKPSPMLFDLAFRPFGVSKDNVVFVGDSWIHDIEGAKRFGISAVWIHPEGTDRHLATHVVRDLRELAR